MILARLLGLILLMGGCFWSLAALGFATMIDPGLQGAAWWAEYRQSLVQGGGLGMIGLGLLAILCGGWLIVIPIDGPARAEAGDRSPPPAPMKRYDLSGKHDDDF